MQSRWMNAAVVMLWIATMSWLVREKVLPPLFVGEAPNYRRIVEAQRKAPPVAWHVAFNERPVGWALTDTKLQSNGLTEIRGRVHFDALPLEELLPAWLRDFSRWMQIRDVAGRLRMDAWSLLCIDPLGRLARFESSVQTDPLKETISIRGVVEGRNLALMVHARNASFSSDVTLPPDALLSDALSPQMQLPGLRAGQTWSAPVCSPLWPVKSPMEIVYATVEKKETIHWNGEPIDAWLVVFRSENGNGAGSQVPRGQLWVHPDGAVLRQQVRLFESTVTFVRLADEEAERLVDSAGHKWWSPEDQRQGSDP